MNIVFATGVYPPDIGGPATYTEKVAEELSRRGDKVTVVTYGGGSVSQAGFRVVSISRRIPKGIRHIVYFFALVWHGIGAHLFFAQDPVSAGLPAFFATRVLRKKYILRVVGDYAWEQGVGRFGVGEMLDEFVKKKYGFFLEMLRRIERLVTEHASHIIVPSEYLREIVRAWGISKTITVIPNGVKPPQLPSRDGARAKLGFTGELVLLSAGRFVPWKGFSCLISLMPEVRKHYPATLIVVGDGPEKPALEGLRDRLKLQNSVVFPGAVSKDLLATYMAASDIFLLNTSYEGFSHQILEALMAGIPIITTGAGGNKEIIRDEENALLVPFNSEVAWVRAIIRVAEDAHLREKLREGGGKCREIYSFESMMEKTLSLIESA